MKRSTNGMRDGEALLQALLALANPHRLRILAALVDGETYVSQLARDLRISRPLLHMHLQRLEAAGLIDSRMEVSEDGKAMRYVSPTTFSITLTPAEIAAMLGRGSGGRIDKHELTTMEAT